MNQWIYWGVNICIECVHVTLFKFPSHTLLWSFPYMDGAYVTMFTHAKYGCTACWNANETELWWQLTGYVNVDQVH